MREQCGAAVIRLQNQLKLTALLLLLPVLPATAQMETMHGTTVVMLLSQDEVTIAADSRAVGQRGPYALYSDDICKVATLSNKVLFAEAGVGSGYCNFLGASCGWRVVDIAREVVNDAQSTHADHSARSLANAWGAKVSVLLWGYYFLSPGRAAHDAPTGVPITLGYFATVDSKGVVNAASAQLFHDQPLFGPVHVFPQVSDIEIPKAGEFTAVIGGSGGDVAIEFLRGTTPRAIAERSKWPTSIAPLEVDTVMEHRAIRLVRLSIDFFPTEHGHPSDVGGPVDAARLTAEGTSWISHKNNCPAD